MGLKVSFTNLDDTTSFFSGKYDVQSVVVTICCALAFYNAFELILLIFTTFRNYRGLYFWSLLIASCGIIPYDIGFMIEYFKLTAQVAGLLITIVGWPMMVTGQSFVLYSRLHVILGNPYKHVLKVVKWMIIIDGVVFHSATTVVVFGAYYAAPNLHFAAAYKYIEKIQMTGFTLQEFILSGLYLWKAIDIIKTSQKKRTSRVMWQLFAINILIVIMDIALLVVEYQDRHVIEQALKGLIYSVKLKLEFAILSKLVGLTKDTEQTLTGAFEDYEFMSGGGRRRSAFTLDDQHIPPHRPSVRTASLMAEKFDTVRLEQITSSTDGLRKPSDASLGPQDSRQSHLSANTCVTDEQRRRRTLDDDLYATAVRDLT